MTNDTKWEELRQAEEMAYFKADVFLYSPESYSLESPQWWWDVLVGDGDSLYRELVPIN